MNTVDGQEGDSDDQAGDVDGQDGFFGREEYSDQHFDDDSWESGSIYSQTTNLSLDNILPELALTPIDTESESDSTLNDEPRHRSDQKTKAKPKLKLKPGPVLEDSSSKSPKGAGAFDLLFLLVISLGLETQIRRTS